MNYPTTIIKENGNEVKLSWIKGSNINDFQPYFQAYGICFDDQNHILLINEGDEWKIPGGTPEKGESAEDTLRRELIEEADVNVSKCILLGAQKVDYPNNPNVGRGGDLFYQLRYVCLGTKLLPQTPDPDKCKIHERKLVPMEEVTTWVKWGPAGEALFNDAIKLYKQLKNGK